MSSTLYSRDCAVIKLVATASLAGKEGYFYKLDSSNQAVIVSSASDKPHGLIGAVSNDGLEISALPMGGNHGPVRVKLGTTITDLRVDLTVKSNGTAESDDGAGARVIVARPLETGVADELVECVLLTPRFIPAQVAGTLTGSVDGTINDVAAAAGACAGGSSPTATQVDTAIATAVAALVTSTNLALKELQTQLNAALV